MVRNKKPVGRKAFIINPFQLVVNCLFGLLVLTVVIVLYDNLKDYRSSRSSMMQLNALGQQIEEDLTRDLFLTNLHRGSCDRSFIEIKDSGSRLIIELNDGRYASVLDKELSVKADWLNVYTLKNISPGMLVRVCSGDVEQQLVIDRLIPYNAQDPDKGTAKFLTSLNSDERGSFDFPRGSMVTSMQRVIYDWTKGRLERSNQKGDRRTYPFVKKFDIRRDKVNKDLITVSYILSISDFEIEKAYSFNWLLISQTLSLNAALAHYSSQP